MKTNAIVVSYNYINASKK